MGAAAMAVPEVSGQRLRVAFFVHGLGANGGGHGRALESGAQAAGWHLHFVSALLGSTGLGTFAGTLAGVADGGRRVAQEVRQVVAALGTKEVALIGASLGGLYCRFAAGLLWGGAGDELLLARPIALVTLATPHLGVRGLFGAGGLQLRLGQAVSSTVADLMWDNSTLRDLAAGPWLAALRGFASRHAYAPTVDDGIVAYPSAAITPRAAKPELAVVGGPLGARRVIDSNAAAEAWCGEEAASFAAGTGTGAAAAVRETAMAVLCAGRWEVVDVGATHKDVATLYPASRSGAPNATSAAVAAEVWASLAGCGVAMGASPATTT